MASPGLAHYVDALEAFVGWTLDTINPAWRTQGRRGREPGLREISPFVRGAQFAKQMGTCLQSNLV
jgi:hypothetical protein